MGWAFPNGNGFILFPILRFFFFQYPSSGAFPPFWHLFYFLILFSDLKYWFFLFHPSIAFPLLTPCLSPTSALSLPFLFFNDFFWPFRFFFLFGFWFWKACQSPVFVTCPSSYLSLTPSQTLLLPHEYNLFLPPKEMLGYFFFPSSSVGFGQFY